MRRVSVLRRKEKRRRILSWRIKFKNSNNEAGATYKKTSKQTSKQAKTNENNIKNQKKKEKNELEIAK